MSSPPTGSQVIGPAKPKRHFFPATMAAADETITKTPESLCVLACEFCSCIRTSKHCQCEACIACNCLGCIEHRARQKILFQKMSPQPGPLVLYFFSSALYLCATGSAVGWLYLIAIVAVMHFIREWILSMVDPPVEPDDLFCHQTRSQRPRLAGKPRYSVVLSNGQTVRFTKTG